MELVYRYMSQRQFGSMAEMVGVVEQGTNDTVAASSVQVSTKESRNGSVRDWLSKEGNYLVERGRRETLELLKCQIEEESRVGYSEDVSEHLFELFQTNTLQILCALLKGTAEERWATLLTRL